MEYFTLDLDLQDNSLQKRWPEAQHEALLTFMHALEKGEAFPEGSVCPIDTQLGSNKQKAADAGLLTGLPAFSSRAQRLITSICGNQVQFIPIHHQPHPETKYQVEDTYAWMNVLHRVPCLEFVKGEVKERRKFWNAQTRVWQERDPAVILADIRFHPEKVEGLHIFRPDEASSTILVSSVLHESLNREDLVALKFSPLKDWLVLKRRVKNDNEGFYPADC